MTEFELIRTFFAAQPVVRDDVAIGIGDDAAVLEAPPGMQLVVTSDVLASGVHFFPDVEPGSLGHKSLAVNLSDLAAMAADPAWFTLSLSLPRVDAGWLRAFCDGMFDLARRYRIQLVGGDTVRGPLSIAITAHGLVPHGQALLRRGAQPGDRIYVTGELGDAGLALLEIQGALGLMPAASAAVRERLTRPQPRVEVGRALRGVASSAIDVSDGVRADLGHILEASGVGGRLRLADLPISHVYREVLPRVGWDVALASGDDYELCFTVPPRNVGALDKIKSDLPCGLAYVGDIVAARGLQVLESSGQPYRSATAGFDHFSRP